MDDHGPSIETYRRQLLICVGPYCVEDGMTPAALLRVGAHLVAAGLLSEGPQRVKPTRVHCLGACRGGPIMCVQPDGVWYRAMTPENVGRVVEVHLIAGRVVADLVFHQGPSGDRAPDPLT